MIKKVAVVIFLYNLPAFFSITKKNDSKHNKFIVLSLKYFYKTVSVITIKIVQMDRVPLELSKIRLYLSKKSYQRKL